MDLHHTFHCTLELSFLLQWPAQQNLKRPSVGHPCTNLDHKSSSPPHHLPSHLHLEGLHIGCILNTELGVHKVPDIYSFSCFEAAQWWQHNYLYQEKKMTFWRSFCPVFWPLINFKGFHEIFSACQVAPYHGHRTLFWKWLKKLE